MTDNRLDFCRIKKFDEKGFGFLRGIYYDTDIFFHLTSIKNKVFKEKFKNLVRGSFFLYFTSEMKADRRKVKQFWYDIEEVPVKYFPELIHRITDLCNEGAVNLFDLVHIIDELKKISKIAPDVMLKILQSKRFSKSPVSLLPVLNPVETEIFSGILGVENLLNAAKDERPYWLDEYIEKSNYKKPGNKPR